MVASPVEEVRAQGVYARRVVDVRGERFAPRLPASPSASVADRSFLDVHSPSSPVR